MKSWKEIEDASTTEIIEWAVAQPWGLTMAACLQDAKWHAEGDVWTHTKMVLAELEQLPEWAELDRIAARQIDDVALRFGGENDAAAFGCDHVRMFSRTSIGWRQQWNAAFSDARTARRAARTAPH